MGGKRWIGVLLLTVSLGVSAWIGIVLARRVKRGPAMDFQAIYFGTRCLMSQRDPYSPPVFRSMYAAAAKGRPPGFVDRPTNVGLFVYLPTACLMIAPLAALPWEAASIVWLILLGTGLLVSATLVSGLWEGTPDNRTFLLVCFLLANTEVLFGGGNAAGIVVSLCVVSAWCLLQQRFVPLGIACMATGLMVKPHDAGLVWLYFLLAGGVHRKRALQCLGICVVLAVIAAFWTSSIAPTWFSEWQRDLWAGEAPGTANDPGLTGNGGVIVDLQNVVAVFRDDPHVYNPVSYAICGVILLVWAVETIRAGTKPNSIRLGLATIAPLTMLVTYHRPYDAKLLFLTIPAFAELWAEGGRLAKLAFFVESAAILLTCDVPLIVLNMVTNHFHFRPGSLGQRLMMIAFARPAPMALLALSLFYLWVYVRSGREARAARLEAIQV